MKNILIKMFSFILIIFACVGLTACNNNPPTTPSQPETPLTFNQRFNFVTAKIVDVTSTIISIDELSNYYRYKSFTLESKKDFTFSHISFKVKGESENIENLYFSVEFKNDESLRGHWITSEPVSISNTEKEFNIYCVTSDFNSFPHFNSSISEYEKPAQFNANADMYFVFTVGTEMMSTGNNSYKANGNIENPISFYDFTIE